MLNIGDKAPDFSLLDQNGTVHTLKSYNGQKVVIYFYPKDNTPGCTTEACNFRDEYAQIKNKAILLGVSGDDQESHKKFSHKYSLPFPLLADTNKETINAYGAWAKKLLYGKSFLGIIRCTYIINEQGRIEKVFPKVNASKHIAEVLAVLNNKT